jgi:hypothetical protein
MYQQPSDTMRPKEVYRWSWGRLELLSLQDAIGEVAKSKKYPDKISDLGKNAQIALAIFLFVWSVGGGFLL